MKIHTILSFFIIVLFSALNTGVQAENLSSEDFLQADVEARRLTLEGMSHQVALLMSGASAQEVDQAVSENQANVEAVFTSFGTSGAEHSAYGTKNRAAIEAWMTGHPEWQQIYDALDAEFTSLSQQLSTLREGR